MGCHRHPVLFWVQMGHFNSCENNTGCQWQLILFPSIWKSCAPYSYQDHLSIQNVKVLSWALNFQNPKPKSDPGSSTIYYKASPWRNIFPQLVTSSNGVMMEWYWGIRQCATNEILAANCNNYGILGCFATKTAVLRLHLYATCNN